VDTTPCEPNMVCPLGSHRATSEKTIRVNNTTCYRLHSTTPFFVFLVHQVTGLPQSFLFFCSSQLELLPALPAGSQQTEHVDKMTEFAIEGGELPVKRRARRMGLFLDERTQFAVSSSPCLPPTWCGCCSRRLTRTRAARPRRTILPMPTCSLRPVGPILAVPGRLHHCHHSPKNPSRT
jgi:hypothetical protein